jgi:hypothetical protein
VTIDAVVAHQGGEHPRDLEEPIDGNAFEDEDVPEALLDSARSGPNCPARRNYPDP